MAEVIALPVPTAIPTSARISGADPDGAVRSVGAGSEHGLRDNGAPAVAPLDTCHGPSGSAAPEPSPTHQPTSPPSTNPCAACTHPPCRTLRAENQVRRCGRSAEFAAEHRNAVALQARYRHRVIWFGEATQSYWAATSAGLIEGADVDALLLALWAAASRTAPRGAAPVVPPLPTAA